MKEYCVAVTGALGAVGQEMLSILESRQFPIKKLKLLDIAENVGKTVKFCGKEVSVELSEPNAFKEVDIALFAVSDNVSKKLAPEAVKNGAIVIDNSSTWRMDPEVPLVVPEVNPEVLRQHKGIIANPNCSTIIAMVPLKPLHEFAGLKRIIASTYQAVSGAGIAGIGELKDQSRNVLDNKPIAPKVFAHQIAFNLIPHIDYFEENAYTHEEMKMFREGRKILGLPELMVNCTCARVPVVRSHSESITIETERPITPDQAREVLNKAPGLKVVDRPENNEYPMPVDTANQDLIFVGRIREDISSTGNGLTFWCCGDQVRKGAALNAVQIAETIIKMELI
ncbi:Aspartate-semialdehyde dehydrogenase [uncultured Clostridium sp.]|uniref:Aspartate-semialdehyde dehydrogenase n=1 Tax=Flintibacter hominis TaxID=2763048 RepID=A0A8J6J6W0_9FIRM|nr:aspartate-semialdehyde dehydrogenase [Flintibacter hominis]MBC5721605.1 aspartate-semialdehyde dehydrogenase [Flintibacter hominis]SCH73010.1 Aspartate-semialdehyde dehydrogenase [uncultured Clostridium sp.]